MIIVFLGTTGVHHALIAAHLYLCNSEGLNMLELPDFGNSDLDHSAVPIFIGHDNSGNPVYALGAGKEVLMAKKSIEDLVVVLGLNPQDLVVQPVSVRGERLFAFLHLIPAVLGGRQINRYLPQYMLKSQIPHITGEVDALRQLYQLE